MFIYFFQFANIPLQCIHLYETSLNLIPIQQSNLKSYIFIISSMIIQFFPFIKAIGLSLKYFVKIVSLMISILGNNLKVYAFGYSKCCQ
ncbi:unnamed protein product (macronuclear) [Paramecium tetraurelia]|uniref:Transmembrane protein n=1 Tax=Paramecium tetraurelia TaxID=5888 RepID=A0DRK3_PARTE|nr:uncharacterized protein GSPATT00019388001 [Paramecium tetraurelia]CAK85670.1 unnamed protein product [Paramecium tetraurelia]|eukprot:XP_001453067.1 hypothetical protein (macronuclear) [Paramecium tetraurelia strain d4-2]